MSCDFTVVIINCCSALQYLLQLKTLLMFVVSPLFLLQVLTHDVKTIYESDEFRNIAGVL